MPNDSYWNTKAAELLVGRTIVAASYMTPAEAKEMDWSCRPVILELDNGDVIIPQADDEGNDGGALSLNSGILPLLHSYSWTPTDAPSSEVLGDPEE